MGLMWDDTKEFETIEKAIAMEEPAATPINTSDEVMLSAQCEVPTIIGFHHTHLQTAHRSFLDLANKGTITELTA
ncbi:MAG: hypothetical protein WD469_07275 [Paenibacillaceae bacterium]